MDNGIVFEGDRIWTFACVLVGHVVEFSCCRCVDPSLLVLHVSRPRLYHVAAILFTMSLEYIAFLS